MLLGLNRSTYYYQPAHESTANLQLMRAIDEKYLETPFYGSRRMAEHFGISRKRAQRLMRIMGIEAVYPKPRTSQSHTEHKVYPYLLKDLEISHANQGWCSDITYIPMERGFLYLVAIMDWYSRFVLDWELSNTLGACFCVEVLERTLSRRAPPKIFNTDQGSQFTSTAFLQPLKDNDITISMDGKGRCFDNIFIERLWRTVKYEHVYLHSYESGEALYHGLAKYFNFYNTQRMHQALGNKTPEAIYHGG